MAVSRSLASRLTLFVTFALMMSYFFSPIGQIIVSLSPYNKSRPMTLNDWALPRVMDMVADALRIDKNGAEHIELTPELRKYMQEAPAFRFAVFGSNSGPSLPGSSGTLVTMLDMLGRSHVPSLSFQSPDNPNLSGAFIQYRTPIGWKFIAVSGFTFRWLDPFYTSLQPESLFSAAPMCTVILVAWLIVRQGLAPLNLASRNVAKIDMNSLDQRIALDDIPTELLPFVNSVNDALARLDKGVANQRRFVADAAHELRTPVTILLTHIENPKDATFRRDLRKDAVRIKTIIEQLLASATLSNRRLIADERVDLGSVALEIILDYMPIAIENSRRIELDCPPESVEVLGDRRAIESAVANLIDNALRAEPEGGAVVVRVKSKGCIEVADHGEGVAPLDRDKVFEPFWRKDGSNIPGTGLGLSIVRDTMERLGGTASIEETPSGGATFKLHFREA
jgi:signal transduction histidine kinase